MTATTGVLGKKTAGLWQSIVKALAAIVAILMVQSSAFAADLTFNRAYQGSLSGQTFTSTSLLSADAGSIRFSDGGNQRAFQNTSGTLTYTIGGVPHSEVGVLNSRYPNGNTQMNAVAFSGGSGDRLLVLGGSYSTSSSYSGSSNAIVAKLNEYIDATAPDPAGTTLLVNGGSTATVSVGATASVVVTVKLSSGTAVSGATVSLSGSPSGGSSISPSSATTNASGQATFTVQGLQSGTVTYTATASANGTSTTSSNTVSVTFVGVRSAAQTTASVPSGTAGRATTVIITVKDSNGNTVTGAASGLSLTVGGSNTGATPSAITDNGNGTYSVTYTPAVSGVDTVAITLDGTAISGSPYSSTVAAAPTPPAITTSTLPTPVLGQAYSQTVATSGGTAPIAFTVTGGALPAGLGLNASTGVISGTATAAGAYSVTVTATDANSMTDAKTYTGTILAGVSITTASLPTPILSQAYSRTLATSGGTAPVTFAVTGGALPAGLSFNASTGVISGTATAAGAYSVTVTATDANSMTDAKTYTGTIAAVLAAPITGPVSTSVLANSSANAIVLNLTGGASTSISIGSAAGHGVATTSGLSVSYTPTAGYSGSDSFTYTATNASGTSSPATITVIVAAPNLTFGPAPGALPGGVAEDPYSQTLSVSSGTAPYAYVISSGALPTGISLDASAGVVAGAPTTAGAYTFDVTVTDVNGAVGTASYSVQIAAAAPVAANSTSATVPANTQTQAGQNVSLNLSSLVSGDVTEVRIVTQPKHGSVAITQTLAMRGGGGIFAFAMASSALISTPSQFVAVYTPDKDFQGVDTFEFVAVGPGGVSTPATATITVVGRPPVAKALTAATTDGKFVSVELTTGASEGPFTSAGLGAVTPVDAATINLVQGGTEAARTFRLDVTPKVRFGGTITVNYTLTNIFGVSSPATVTIEVSARPDPSADPTVQAISDAQAEAARRFSRAQVDNFMRRAESLHGVDCLVSANGVRLNPIDRQSGRDERGRTDGPQASPSGDESAQPVSDGAAARPESDRACHQGQLSVWTAGSIELSTRDASSNADKIRATSSGLTLGVDAKISDRANVGLGVGYGKDRSRIGDGAGRVAAQSKVLAAYGSFTPVDDMFIDLMIARGWLDFDTRRLDPTSGATTLGARDGQFTTIALSSGIDRQVGQLRWSSYGRLEYLNGSLDAYREAGAGIFDLRFDARKIRSTLGVLGVRGTHSQAVRVGILTSGMRAEWRHEFAGGADQRLDYADVRGASYYSLKARGWSRDAFVFDPELGLLLPSGWEIGLSGGIAVSTDQKAVHGTVEARKRF
ncbi:putative Ig domain-containing protein [Caulobacter sp. DWR1-3-2b1]|uniref:putative Ig domain-containing protein n=1 Tax=Caulobacter sp. DWR1-3-2b1 TaxID=2804670 RepID=UPI003CF8D1E5